MLLKLVRDQHLVAVNDITELTNPLKPSVLGCLQWGEEEQEAEAFAKGALCFPSGEPLPRCWCDEHYRDAELPRGDAG